MKRTCMHSHSPSQYSPTHLALRQRLQSPNLTYECMHYNTVVADSQSLDYLSRTTSSRKPERVSTNISPPQPSRHQQRAPCVSKHSDPPSSIFQAVARHCFPVTSLDHTTLQAVDSVEGTFLLNHGQCCCRASLNRHFSDTTPTHQSQLMHSQSHNGNPATSAINEK